MGKKKNKPKKKKTKIQQAAAERHANFKKTGVQTFGGTKKTYTKKEVAKIDKAGLSRSAVTGGVLKNKPTPKPTPAPAYKPRAEAQVIKNKQASIPKPTPVSTYKPRAEAQVIKDKQASVSKPTGNPAVMSADGTFNRPGPGGPEPAADYTPYQSGSFYNQTDTNMNVTNALRSARNVVTQPLQSLGINTGLTNRLIPKSDEAIQDAKDQRSNYNVANDANIVSVRKTKSKSGGIGILSNMKPPAEATTTPVEEILETSQRERYEPAPPPPNLNQLQIDSYNTALESYNAGQGFTGQGVGTGFGNLSQPVIQALIAGTRGRKRFRYGARPTERGGGSGTGLRRGSQRFQQFTTQGQLNI